MGTEDQRERPVGEMGLEREGWPKRALVRAGQGGDCEGGMAAREGMEWPQPRKRYMLW